MYVMYVCMYVGGRLGKLVLLNGRFYLFFHHNSQDPSREAQPWWSHHLWDYSIVKAWYTANKLCGTSYRRAFSQVGAFTKRALQSTLFPAILPQCGERASHPQRGCNGYFLPTPMTLYSDEVLFMEDAHCPLCRFVFLWKFVMPRYKCWSGSLICIFPHIEKHELEASFEDELALVTFQTYFPILVFATEKLSFLNHAVTHYELFLKLYIQPYII